MTDASKPVELQHLTSRESRMSGTGSFGHAGESFATETTMVTTDTEVGAMGPLYQTVPEAGKSHAQYKAEKVRGASSPAGNKHYMTPGDPTEPNEYDIINDRQVRGKGKGSLNTPPQVRLHSENVLYGDQATAAEDFRHATLTMDHQQQKYSGSVHDAITYEPESKSTYCCGCKPIYVWMCFFVFLGLVIAIVALAMVLVVAFGVYEIPCNCDDPTNTPIVNIDLTDIMAQMDKLNLMLEELNSSTLSISSQVGELQQNLSLVSERVNTTEEELTPAGIQDILSGGGVSFGATLAGVNPYVNCTTELVRQNTIAVPAVPTEPSFGVTETGSVDLDEPGYYTTHAFCARIDSSSEVNPFVATLRVLDTGAVSCQCYIVVPDPGQFQSFAVQCGLYITRCPIQQDIDTIIQT